MRKRVGFLRRWLGRRAEGQPGPVEDVRRADVVRVRREPARRALEPFLGGAVLLRDVPALGACAGEHLRSPTDDVRASLTRLVSEQVELAQSRLTASRQLIDLVPPQTRPFLRAMLEVQQLRLRAVHRKGGHLADGSTRPALPALFQVLAREYRAARRQTP